MRDSWRRLTCVYSSLCALPPYRLDQDWVYITAEDEEEDESADPGELRGGLTVSLNPSTSPHSAKGGEGAALRWSPRPVGAAEWNRTVAAAAAVALVGGSSFLFAEYNAENFGHFLGDVLLPAYSATEALLPGTDLAALRMLRVPGPNWYSCDWQCAQNLPGSCRRCARNYKQLTPLLTDRPVELASELFEATTAAVLQHHPQGPARDNAAAAASAAAAATAPRPAPSDSGGRGGGANGSAAGVVMCFERMLAGSGDLADHCDDPSWHGRLLSVRHDCNRHRSAALLGFGGHMRLRALGAAAAEDRCGHGGAAGSILVALPLASAGLGWRGRTDVSLLSEALQRLRETYRHTAVAVAEVTLAMLTVPAQVAAVSAATCLITTAGGGALAALWLRPGATLIVVHNRGDTAVLDWHLLNFLGHVHTEHVRPPARRPAEGRDAAHRQVLRAAARALRRYRSLGPCGARRGGASSSSTATSSGHSGGGSNSNSNGGSPAAINAKAAAAP